MSQRTTAALVYLCLLAAGSPLHAQTAGGHLAASVVGVGITVRDLDTSLAFYRDVLSCKVVGVREEDGDAIERVTGVFGVRRRTATLLLGLETIELSDYLAPEGRSLPEDSRSNDRWFQHIAIVVPDMERAYAHLREHNVRHASSGPQTLPQWNRAAAGIRAFYFKDPDGHPLELIWFPEGKGDPKWPRLASEQPDAMFLGIDHTAIVVRDTRASLALYEGVLGMRVAGGSENSGTEQERLNNVFGARLRITTLRAHDGIGVELLEYLSPTTGREYPRDAGANDLMHVHTLITGSFNDSTRGVIHAPHVTWISSAFADPDRDGQQPMQGMLRDPDGHAVVLMASVPRTKPGAIPGTERERSLSGARTISTEGGER
jgi:catechol 2,3-dioxygenase-like lactoylglutathione lyase family enzyme